MNDLYSILELDVHAKDEDIKKHFRKLSLKYHPDKNGSKEKFIELKDAYDILIDKEKRKIYDYQRKFDFLKDFNLDYNDLIYLNELYEKFLDTNEIKLCKILFNTLPENIKNKMYELKKKLSENLFSSDLNKEEDLNKDLNKIIVPSKYINIEGLNENYTINLNISIEDVYCNKLKKIIVHTKDFICYLFLRDFNDIKIKNGNYNFSIKFNINQKQKGNYIKRGNDLIIIKIINIYELLFEEYFKIYLPDKNINPLNIKRNDNNFLKIKGYGFNGGDCIILFNLDYAKNYIKHKENIKEIFN